MNKKERLMIYPYDIEAVPLMRYRELLDGYEICSLVSPGGWGFAGKDAGAADGGAALGMLVSSDFEGQLETCDTVYFSQSHIKLDFDSFIKPKLLKALAAGKNIVCSLPMDRELQQEIHELCSSSGLYFKHFNNQKKIEKFMGNEEIYEMNTPVVFVLGISERTQKLQIQLALRAYAKAQGYKISQIGSRGYCELFGFRSFPQFMYDHSFSESQKIVLFNRYVKSIEMKEQPDLIVIGIPGGVLPFDNRLTNKFGIMAYEISQAIVPDAVIFSILYEAYGIEQLEAVSNLIRYRLGFEIDGFNLSNTKFDWEASKQDEEVSYITVDSEFLHLAKEKYHDMTHPVYGISDAQDAVAMSQFIIGKLEQYAEVQSV